MFYLDACPIPSAIMDVIKDVYTIILIAVPIILLIIGTIDLAKAVMAGDEKGIKEGTSLLGKRAIAAVMVFLLGTIVSFVLGLVPKGQGYLSCWGTGTTTEGTATGFSISCPSSITRDGFNSGTAGTVLGTVTSSETMKSYQITSGFALSSFLGTRADITTTKDVVAGSGTISITVTNAKGETAGCSIPYELITPQ
jgi:hypothetical protein